MGIRAIMMADRSTAPPIETLAAVATAARAVMEECRSDPGEFIFQKFPRRACGATCELLGRYFIEILGVDARYVAASRAGRTHAWLAVGDIIIDITADQFGQAPVIVTRESAWHAEWDAEKGRPPICSQAQWAMYPLATWRALAKSMEARGFGSTVISR